MQFYYWCELKIMNVSWSSLLWFLPHVAKACISCALAEQTIGNMYIGPWKLHGSQQRQVLS